jgi:hypothetical protein
MTGVREKRALPDGSENGSIRPFDALQDRPHEGAISARERSSAEGVGRPPTVFRSFGRVARDLRAPFRNSLSGVELIKQRLGVLQVARVETLGEPAVIRSEEIAGLLAFTLDAPKPGEAQGGAQLE